MIDPNSLRPFLGTALEGTNFPALGKLYKGKVRDVYEQEGKKILIATDRQSAFDISWCTIPLKGQVLSQISAWWFDRIKDIMPLHVIDFPDPNVTVGKELKIIMVEIVVRAYLTGSTKTSAWVNYNNGVRNFCGNPLRDGMVKNQPLDEIIITPTTKSDDDEPIDPEGIVSQGLATAQQWEEITEKAFALFKRGQEIADEKGLILVDTKYEMGLDENGVITLADEVHTPDSSRYWVKDTYEERFNKGEEPEYLDKEFFRLWMREHGFEYGDKSTWPEISDDVRVMLASKYIDLYEKMTGDTFAIPKDSNVLDRIEKNLEPYMIKTAA
ncbi:phosphoribosylaminoimidazolesuccinocarboxamide synthase [Patescibacteria group bacterium]|nr:phosphoribosylaminoimidazolesuccinocarboxamide synthase [Patescibacteria group bacterium]MBU1124258.1 phosphoribosylaminoimidazolesuccinocarboxamide synthase [Patescibacteria group bacterium]